jgi:hypothetical protein
VNGKKRARLESDNDEYEEEGESKSGSKKKLKREPAVPKEGACLLTKLATQIMTNVMSYGDVQAHINMSLTCKQVNAVGKLPQSWTPRVHMRLYKKSGNKRYMKQQARVEREHIGIPIFYCAPPLSFWKQVLSANTKSLHLWFFPQFETMYGKDAPIKAILQLLVEKCASSLESLKIQKKAGRKPPTGSLNFVDVANSEALSQICKLTELKVLQAPELVVNCDMKSVFSLENLTKMEIIRDFEKLGVIGYAACKHGVFSKMPLTKLEFHGSHKTGWDTERVSDLLPRLSGSFQTLTALQLPNRFSLSEVFLHGTLTKFPNLTDLNILDPHMYEESMLALCNLGLRLKRLHLMACPFLPSALKDLHRLPLTDLDLSESPQLVRGEGMTHISKVTTLRRLHLTNNVCDISQYLLGIIGMPKLTQLNVTKKWLSKKVRAMLVKQMPKLEFM